MVDADDVPYDLEGPQLDQPWYSAFLAGRFMAAEWNLGLVSEHCSFSGRRAALTKSCGLHTGLVQSHVDILLILLHTNLVHVFKVPQLSMILIN